MLVEHVLQGLGEIAEEMKPIRNLRRGGGSLPCPISIGGRAIAGDDLDPRMLLEPLRQRGTLAVWQERDGLMAFQVDEDGAICVAFPEGEIVHSQHGGRGQWRRWLPAEQAEEGVPAHREAPALAEAPPGLASQSHPKIDEVLGEP
jgi:hypothetical protein